MPLGRRRIHIAPIGYEKERVYKPPIESGADKVILIEHRSNTKSNEITKGEECKAAVHRELADEGIRTKVEECDLFDINSCVLTIAEAVESFSNDDVYVNLATGSKLSAIGGMIACTATHAVPYYVHAEGYEGEAITTGVADMEELSTYPLTLPHQQYLEVLAYIEEESKEEDTVIKGDIVSYAQDLPLLSEYDRDQERNMYDPVEKEIIEPLVNQEYLKREYRGNETRYYLTEEGKETLQILKYLVD